MKHMSENWRCFPFCDREYVESQTGWWIIQAPQEELMGTRIPAHSAQWTGDARREGIEVLKAIKAKDEEALAVLEELAQMMKTGQRGAGKPLPR